MCYSLNKGKRWEEIEHLKQTLTSHSLDDFDGKSLLSLSLSRLITAKPKVFGLLRSSLRRGVGVG